MISTADYFRLVSPSLPAQLASSSSVASISDLAAILPPSTNFGLECRLNSSTGEADFLVAVIPSDGSLAAWSGKNSLTVSHEFQPATSAWAIVRELLADWHGGTPEMAPLHDAWLEFDLEGRAAEAGVPDPSFFFGFDSDQTSNYPALTLALVERLLGHPLAEAQRDKLLQCFAALPQRAVIFQVGVMLARPSSEIRLCLRHLSAEAILVYLNQLGWPGSVDELGQKLVEVNSLVDYVLGVDISLQHGCVSPAIGIEVVIESGRNSHRKAAAFLDYLISQQACREDKKEALLRWTGNTTEDACQERWPPHLLKASQAMGSRVRSSFARTLNHFKISYQKDKAIGAKVYLGVRHFWAQVAQDKG